MKTILLLSIAVLSFASDGHEIYVYGLSYHSNRDYPFKEVNPGLGYGYTWVKEDRDNVVAEGLVQGSVYQNSYGHWTGVTTIGPRVTLGDWEENFYGFFSVTGGFVYSEDYKSLVILPTVGFGYKRLNINFVFMPKTDNKDTHNDSSSAIGLFLGFKL